MTDVAYRGGRRAFALVAMLALGLTVACTDDPDPPFQIEGTGTVEGFLFLDVDDDGVFDPSDGDEPVSGVNVAALSRGTSEVLATATTGANGRFVIEALPPGSHEILFDEGSIPDGVNVCQNPVPTTVYRGERAFTAVAARTACLVTILEVQESAVAGDFVIVRGVVTAFPGQFDEGDGAIQDESGGIWLFDGSIEGRGLEVGDLVEIGGTVDLAVESLQLIGVVVREVIEDFGAPDPVEVTTGEIAAASNPRAPLQNMLATVRGAQLTTAFDTGGDRNATIDDGSGGTLIRVESVLSPSAGGGILTTTGMEVGSCYDITGIVGAFFGTAQLFPRSTADIVEVPCGS